MIKKLNKFIIFTALLFQLTNSHADATADQNNLAEWQAAAKAFSSQGTPAQLLQKQGRINAGSAKAIAGSSPQAQALGLYLASGNSARNANSFPGNEGLDAAAGLNMVINAATNSSNSTSTTNTTSTANKVATPTTPVATPTNPVAAPTNPVAAPTTDSIRTGLQGQINGAQQQITTLNAQITTLNAQITTLNAQITTLNAQLSALPA